jgi:dTDP-4-dehydrorhamnose 3,5-epimerase
MKFVETPIPGAYVVDLERLEDNRGFFARSWCEQEFESHGLVPHLSQVSVSYNRWKGTLRGLHYQVTPHEEQKLVRCTRGSAFDVLVDVRRDSPVLGRWFSIELTMENRRAVYIPAGIAHGFQTVEDDTELLYLISSPYNPDAARVLRWDDATVGVVWPIPEAILSTRDAVAPGWSEIELQ